MNQFQKSYRIQYSGISDKGYSRERNEDNFIIGDISNKELSSQNISKTITTGTLGFVMAVADGVGGEKAGEVASKTAIESLNNFFTQSDFLYPISDEIIGIYLHKIIFDAHNKIANLSIENQNFENMQTTLTILWVFNDKLYISWSGDSRAYLLRKDECMKMLTFDHSYVRELVKRGLVTIGDSKYHPYRNVITQSLGHILYPPNPDFIIYDLKIGDRILLCSDGLNNMIDDIIIESILRELCDTSDATIKLISKANEAGGKDNITVLLSDIDAIS
jgi:PPM family protein phosphatase